MQPFRSEVASRLAELAPAMLARLDVMTDRMLEVLLRTEPTYRELAAARETDLRRSTRDNLERGIRALIAIEPGEGARARAAAREVGRRRAAQGIPLEAVLRAYRLGGQVTWEGLLSASREGGREPDGLLLEVAGVIWRTNDAHCGEVAEGYREEQRRRARLDEQVAQEVLDGLLDGRGGDPVFVRRVTEQTGLPLDGRLVAVVAPAGAEEEPALPEPATVLLRRGVRSLWGVRSGAQVGVVALGGRRVAEVLGWLQPLATGAVGVSAVVEGAAEVACAYRLADAAARTLPTGSSGVVTIDDRLPEALLSNSPEISSRLVGQSLGRLLELPADERTVLLDTLAAFLASDGSPTRAADELYCHRNTVMHRLRRIEAVTGRRLDDPRARLLWQLALLDTEHARPLRTSA